MSRKDRAIKMISKQASKFSSDKLKRCYLNAQEDYTNGNRASKIIMEIYESEMNNRGIIYDKLD